MTMTPHPDDLLSAMLDDELDQQTERVVDRHLSDCAACRDELAQIDQVRRWLRELPPVPAPSGLVGGFIAHRRRANLRAASLGMAAAAVAVVTSLVFADPADVAGNGSAANGPRASEKQERTDSESRPERDGPRGIRSVQDVGGSGSSLADRVEDAARDLLDFFG
jgi:anti-sigma factor RsiW